MKRRVEGCIFYCIPFAWFATLIHFAQLYSADGRFLFFCGFVSLVSFRSWPEKRFGERRGVEQNALRDRILPFIGISVDAQINRQNVAGINSRVF